MFGPSPSSSPLKGEEILGFPRPAEQGAEGARATELACESQRDRGGPGQGEGNVRQIAIGALKWNDLKRNPEQDISFDWDDILNMQGNSGPYVQYTFVRTQSILRKLKIDNGQLTKTKNEFSIINSQLSIHDIGHDLDFQTYSFVSEEFALVRTIYYFNEVIYGAASDAAPHLVCTYLFDLSQKFNLFYQKMPILKAKTEEQKNMRVVLVQATGKVIKEGLRLLGIEAPEKM